LLSGSAALWAHPAFAANALKFGSPPDWVHPQPIPDTSTKNADAPIAVILKDEQLRFDRGSMTAYSEVAIKYQNAQGLAAGNIFIVWQPETDTVTVNKLQIRRGGKMIDVLAAGQTFTVLRRETNLDAATLDGTLTATLQPEGLQVGDIIDFATTTEHKDPVLKGHVEAMFGAWDGLPLQTAHAVLSWPTGMPIQLRETPNLPSAQRTSSAGVTTVEFTGHDVQPLVTPKDAPVRFKIGRLAEATDFASWADLSNLFRPLFREASAISATGPLHDEIEKIRAASNDPKTRTEQALALVQDRVRYVALLMGQGGYVPASAETTWSRRFGDCKAKTALLLGILHSLGIQAEPVLAQARLGDMIADRLPMVALFNHVLVRAHIGGKDYWLDGTRTGDTGLDAIETPDFGWGLPLVPDAKLVRMIPAPLTTPSLERHVAIDASAGIYSPATVAIDEVSRGDSAVELNAGYSGLTAEQRDQQLHDEAKSFFDDFTSSSSSVQFDKARREFRMTIRGTAKLSWKDSWFYVPTSVIGFDPDFDRATGPLHDVPITVSHPKFVKDQAVLKLPHGFAAQQKLDAPVHETLAGVEYSRSETVSGDVLTVDSSERSIAPEVPYKEALAAEGRLRELSKDSTYLSSSDYKPMDADLAAMQGLKPTSAEDYFRRADAYLSHGRTDEALNDYNAGLQLDPKDVSALGKRIFINTQKGNYDAAERDLDTVEAADPNNDGVPGARAMVAEAKREYRACVNGYTKLLERQPNQGYAMTHRAMCEASLEDNEAALTDSAAALKIDPKSVELRVLRANIFMRQGKRDLVEAEAEAMTSANPTSDFVWVAAGKTYAALGQRERAMRAFEHALAMKPLAYIYINRAEARAPSDITGKTRDLDAALKLEPGKPEALQEKAQLLSETGDYKGALAVLDQMKVGGNDHLAFYVQQQRAILLYKSGRRAEGEKLFDSLRSATKDATDLNNMCYTQATADILLDSALQDCRDALKISPESGAYLDSLGMVLLRLGKLDEALAAYNAAIAKGEGAPSLMGRAFVYLQKGDRARAQADADAARKLYPDIDETFAAYGLKLDQTGVHGAVEAGTAH
jgi:tetratricopeptide (TPR) repeat protein